MLLTGLALAAGCSPGATTRPPRPAVTRRRPAPRPVRTGSVEMRGGTLYLDGQPRFFYTADYPYYRDDPANWGLKLDRLREMNVPVVTFYIPWRHHCPEAVWRTPQGCDFTGRTQPNRNVVGFLRMVAERGLLAVVKPGPFIHAETNYGGLPDYVRPGGDSGIQPELDAEGNPREWQHAPLPSAADPEFQRQTQRFFGLLERVVAPEQYPQGPVVAVQILNEGVFSAGQRPVNSFDYSPPALALWQAFVRERHGATADVEPPRRFAPGAGPEAALPYLQWAEFSGHFYETMIRTYRAMLPGLRVPFVININPPEADAADSWIARNHGPAGEPVAHYGFTNWVGVLAHDQSAYSRYQLVARMRRGVCMEENWGFGRLYDPAYAATQPSYFQSMAFLALGATGLNVYTGAATARWDPGLDSEHEPPYPSAPPIDAGGERQDKFWTALQLGDLLRGEGADLVRSRARQALAFGLYLPYAYGAAWSYEPEAWRPFGALFPPRAGSRAWSGLLALGNRLHVDTGVVDLERATDEALREHRALVVFGSAWMDAATLARLEGFVRGGGRLIWFGEVPTRDERMAPSDAARGLFGALRLEPFAPPPAAAVELAGGGRATLGGPVAAFDPAGWEPVATVAVGRRRRRTVGAERAVGAGRLLYLSFLPFETAAQQDANVALVDWLVRRALPPEALEVRNADNNPSLELRTYHLPAQDRTFVFALSYSATDLSPTVAFGDAQGRPRTVRLAIPAYSAAAVSLAGDRIDAAMLKGINDHDRRAVAPWVEYGTRRLAARAPSDLVMARLPGSAPDYVVSVAHLAGAERTRVELPFAADEVTVSVLDERAGDGGRGAPAPVEVGRTEGGAARFEAEDVALHGRRYRVSRRTPSGR